MTAIEDGYLNTSPYIAAEAKKLGITVSRPHLRERMLFPLGRVVITPGAETALTESRGEHMMAHIGIILDRHVRGDWGCVCDEDKALNDASVGDGNRILSAYPIDPSKECKGFGDNCIWIITEADRSVTTLLLPEEY